ncbi:hypothetical protein [Streptomyces sp. NPDC088794]|uniref:hypothetical protein n=1 Tax=Streptomyces sp. NPDC088794 TaxID=3365902 RepID=UPI0037F32764
MRLVEQLLRGTDIGVAAGLGFAAPSSLSHVFRREVGFTPATSGRRLARKP